MRADVELLEDLAVAAPSSTAGSSAKAGRAARQLDPRRRAAAAWCEPPRRRARRGRGPPSGAPARRRRRLRDRRVPATRCGKSARWTLSGAIGLDAGDEVVPDRIGEVRDDRRHERGQRRQHLVQRRVRGALVGVELALPEPASVAAHVPVGEVVDEGLDRPRGAHRVVAVERLARLGDERVEARQDPSVEERAGALDAVGLVGRPAVEAGVRHEEPVRVPERQEEAAHDLVRRARSRSAG